MYRQSDQPQARIGIQGVTRMKAAVLLTPNSVPYLCEFKDPVANEEFEVVELVATGIHPVVRALAENRHYGNIASYPLVPGIDAVVRTTDGELLYSAFIVPPYGTMAERMLMQKGMRIRLPDGAEPAHIAGGLNPGLASWLTLSTRRAERGSLGTVVVLGSTGAAGQLAVQNAQLLGARNVLGVGRDAARLASVSAIGARTVRLQDDLEADSLSIMEALEGEDPCLILDFVWGAPAEAMFLALKRRGFEEDKADIRYVQIGSAAAEQAVVPGDLLRRRRIQIQGSGAGAASISDIMDQLPVYIEMISSGRVKVPVQKFPLSRAHAAWVASQKAGSRVIVVPD
jgi:NADPH:quinone reductase-like Zn-dependent oxidoreductase